MTALVLSVDQPYATAIMLGLKRYETRPSPPNGDMRPEGVRGLPGARVNRGDRILIASTARKPVIGSPNPRTIAGGFLSYHRLTYPDRVDEGYCWTRFGSGDPIDLPLGCILGAVTVTDAYPIVDLYGHAEDVRRGLIVSRADELNEYPPSWLTPTGAHGARTIADQRPWGDWTPGRWAWALADPEPLPEPIPVTGKQGVWRWEP